MKKRYIAIFLILGAIIGILLTLQFLSRVPTGGAFLTDELQAKESLIKDFLNEQSYLQSRIVFLRKEIESSQNIIQQHTQTTNLSLLDSLKKDVGLTEIQGKGLDILIDDSPFALRKGANVSDIELVQAADIRDVINVLFASKAEAISVNNQRIIATSPITSVGTTILINNAYIAPPFTISAIGDMDLMIQRLLNEKLLSALYERCAKYKIIFKITKKDWVTVPIYNGNLKYNYINLVE